MNFCFKNHLFINDSPPPQLPQWILLSLLLLNPLIPTPIPTSEVVVVMEEEGVPMVGGMVEEAGITTTTPTTTSNLLPLCYLLLPLSILLLLVKSATNGVTLLEPAMNATIMLILLSLLSMPCLTSTSTIQLSHHGVLTQVLLNT